jgi:hypothetical protein
MRVKEQFEKELEKLNDLEFEYKWAILSKQDEEIVALAKSKMMKQARKVDKLSEMSYNEQKEENSVNVQEEEKPCEGVNK